MATTFDWKSLLPIIATMGNIAELADPGGAAFVPLTQAAEAALFPLLANIGTGKAVDIQSETMAFYATAIAGWNLAKTKAGLDAATLAKIDQNIASTTDSLNAYFKAGVQFDPAEFTPVTPIVVPTV